MLVTVGDERILLSNLDGDFYAISEVCTHASGPLSQGHVEGIEIECPWHGSHFNLKTGGVTAGPALERLARFQVKVVGNDVFVGPQQD